MSVRGVSQETEDELGQGLRRSPYFMPPGIRAACLGSLLILPRNSLCLQCAPPTLFPGLAVPLS